MKTITSKIRENFESISLGKEDLRHFAYVVKAFLFGNKARRGVVVQGIVYYLLVCIGFVYIYPLLYMFSQSMKDVKDLLDPTVIFIPTRIYVENFVRAFKVLNYGPTLMLTLMKSLLPAAAHALSCGMAGLALAKYKVPGKSIIIGLLLLTFIIPLQVTMIPQFLLFKKYNMLGSPLPFIVPALLASGIGSSLFVLVYMQFFRSMPDSYIEAAEIDGATTLGIFFRIVVPISVPAIVTIFLFSMVWHWNETYVSSLYLGDSKATLPLALKTFADSYQKVYGASSIGQAGDSRFGIINLNESIRMAGTVLIILPLLILYGFTQKAFVEVVDRAGITGE